MIKYISLIIVLLFVTLGTACAPNQIYNGSSTAVVVAVGAHIKARDSLITIKYNRKDCPVCKGKGWYISGDGIEKVACGYCEDKSLNNHP